MGKFNSLLSKLQRGKKRGITNINRRHPHWWLATWGGVGLLPAGGTWGSLAALPFAWAFLHFGGWPTLCVATLLVTLVGVYSADWFDRESQTHDAGDIVIDEVAGQWLTCLLLTNAGALGWFAAFFLFRLFDVVKPFPINTLDKHLPGGLGVMLDDILAGVYAFLTLFLLMHFGVL